MLVEELLRLRPLSAIDQQYQLFMLITKLTMIEIAAIKRLQQAGTAFQLRVQFDRDAVARQRNQEIMKLYAKFTGQAFIVLAQCCLLSFDVRAQFRQQAVPGIVAKLGYDPLLHYGQGFKDLDRLGDARLCDKGATIAFDRDETILGQSDERLANDNAADIKDIGEFPLSQLGPRHKPVRQDCLANRRRDLLRPTAHVSWTPT